jgi:hypothetical protein
VTREHHGNRMPKCGADIIDVCIVRGCHDDGVGLGGGEVGWGVRARHAKHFAGESGSRRMRAQALTPPRSESTPPKEESVNGAEPRWPSSAAPNR